MPSSETCSGHLARPVLAIARRVRAQPLEAAIARTAAAADEPYGIPFLRQLGILRGTTLTVAERARLPIIGLRYGLLRYFAR